jgi:hypothetical protein
MDETVSVPGGTVGITANIFGIVRQAFPPFIHNEGMPALNRPSRSSR